MCGIFGAIGQYDKDKLKILALLNQERGKDSFGVYRRPFNKKTGVMYKIVDKPTEILNEVKLNTYMKSDNGIFMGHTRFATRGDKNKVENAHPFIKGNIIGTHNGVIYNINELEIEQDTKFEVDSEVIFHLLDKEDSHKKAFSHLQGYWGLSWIDKREPKKLWLTTHNNTLYYVKIENKAIYYSSDNDHLKLIMGHRTDGEIKKVPNNQSLFINEDLSIRLGKQYNTKLYSYTPPKTTTITKSTFKTNKLSGKAKENIYGGSDAIYDYKDMNNCDCCGVDILDTPSQGFYWNGRTQLCRDCAKYFIEEYHHTIYDDSNNVVTIKQLEEVNNG